MLAYLQQPSLIDLMKKGKSKTFDEPNTTALCLNWFHHSYEIQ